MQMPPPLPPSPLMYAGPSTGGVHGGSIAAWIIIALIAIAVPVLTELGARPAVKPTTQPAGPNSQLVMSGRYSLQAGKILGNPKDTVDQFERQSPGADGQIAGAILRGELIGRDAAIERLDAIATDDASDVRKLYDDPHAVPTDRGSFLTRYPWYGDLVRVNGAPINDPLRQRVYRESMQVFVLILVGGGSVVGLASIGGMLLILAIILLALGKMRMSMPVPAGPSHTYVEAFAAYLLTMIVGSIAFELLAKALKIELSLVPRMLPLALAVLVGIAWPIARGASWDVFRRDIGLHTGRGVLTELGCGLVGYIAGLPILGIFFGVTWLLMHLSGETPSHPLTEQANDLSPLVMLLVASFFAPITEEIMFRGLLLANLRGALRGAAAFVLAPLIVGFIFASIHPQGWIGIPILTAIGGWFAVMRMWRGSLIGPMLAHAVHNGAVVTFVILVSST